MNTYFLVLTQPSNVGDLLINKMLIKELARHGNVYVDCYNCPDDFRDVLFENMDNVIDLWKEYHYTVKRLNFIKFRNILKKKSIKLFTQSPGPFTKIHFLPLRLALNAIHKIVSMVNIPFVRIGNCCSEALAKGEVISESYVDSYYLRSHQSVEYLKKMTDRSVYYFPDLSFLYSFDLRKYDKKKIAVFCFREVTGNLDSFISGLKYFVSKLLENGYKIKIAYQVKSDEAFSKYIYSIFKCDKVSYHENLIWYNQLDFYKDVNIVFSNRLHSLLIGAMYGAIPVAFTNSENVVRKISDVFDSSISTISKELLLSETSYKNINSIIIDSDSYRKKLAFHIQENSRICRLLINELVEKLDK